MTEEQVRLHQERVAAGRDGREAPLPPSVQENFGWEKSEAELQDLICQYLRLKGVVFTHQPMFRKSQLEPGYPDYSFAWKGIPIALEAKSATGTQTEEQKAMQARMEANGWHFYVVRSLDEVRKILTRAD